MESEPKRGKVLPFLPPKSRLTPASRPPLPRRPWASTPSYWLLWWAVAWTVAAFRVHTAAVRREVFGVESTLAFLVAVVLPIVSAPLLFDLARRVLRALAARKKPRAPEVAPRAPIDRQSA